MVAQRLVTVLWVSAVASLAAQEGGHTTPAPPSFEKAPCPFTAEPKIMEQVECGYLTVRENRAASNGRHLKLAVATMKSLGPTPRPDPIVVLGGGPGIRMVDLVPGYVRNGTMDAVRADRPVLVYDPRGVGYSEPTFCPDASAAMGASSGDPRGPAAYRAVQRQQLARCGEYMRAAGYDLSQYNSVVNAHDLDELRRALGYTQWNLRAASYGTRLALVAMRVAPQGIRSAVLDGPVPPDRATWFNKPADFVDILERLSAACAAQPACGDAFPNVAATFWRAVEAFERAPQARTFTLPSGSNATVTVSGSMIAAAISSLLDRGMYSLVPLAIHAIVAGNEAVLTQLRDVFASGPDAAVAGRGAGGGLHYTVRCFDEAVLNTAELRQRMRSTHPAVLIDGGVFPDPTLCDGLHTFRAGAEHAVATESEIPTLIFTGEFDMQTHRSTGAVVGRSLQRSQLVEIPRAGHVQSWRYECTRGMMRDFYNTPLRPVDTSCVKSLPPLEFLTTINAIPR